MRHSGLPGCAADGAVDASPRCAAVLEELAVDDPERLKLLITRRAKRAEQLRRRAEMAAENVRLLAEKRKTEAN